MFNVQNKKKMKLDLLYLRMKNNLLKTQKYDRLITIRVANVNMIVIDKVLILRNYYVRG